MNLFRNSIPNKKVKYKYVEALWINKNIKSTLNKRSWLTKRYYVHGQVQSDYDLLISYLKKCREMILSSKPVYMLKMSYKNKQTINCTKILLVYF